VLNCGYGRGSSVFDVIASVRRVAAVDFTHRIGSRRPGDPAALVADAERIGKVLDWHPKLGDLDTIVGHAILGTQTHRTTRKLTVRLSRWRVSVPPATGVASTGGAPQLTLLSQFA
jgi:UDP-glucose 4-epimerase